MLSLLGVPGFVNLDYAASTPVMAAVWRIMLVLGCWPIWLTRSG